MADKYFMSPLQFFPGPAALDGYKLFKFNVLDATSRTQDLQFVDIMSIDAGRK